MKRSLFRPQILKSIANHLSSTPRLNQVRTFIRPPNLPPDDEWHEHDAGNSGLYLARTRRNLDLKNKLWGFTIYRCTYGDDQAWSKFLTALHENVREGLEFYGTEEMIDSLDYCVHEDVEVLNGAGKEVVRKRFREWVSSGGGEAEGGEQGRRIDDDDGSSSVVPPIHSVVQGLASSNSARYAYCIHIDEEALQSVLSLDPHDRGGHVNIIKADWTLPSEAEKEQLRQEFDNMDPFDEGYEEIEGCRMRDVGWMKVGFEGLMPDAYVSLELGDWENLYWRPPERAFWL